MVSFSGLYVLCWVAPLLYYARKKTPYFPIEISRCAEVLPGPLRVCAATLPVMLLLARDYTVIQSAVFWVALMVIAFFDDRRHWIPHMCGVAALGLFFLMSCARWQILIMSVLYFSRIAIKVYALLNYEQCSPPEPGVLREHALQIMYTGKVFDGRTKRIFRWCGVLQWACFAVALL